MAVDLTDEQRDLVIDTVNHWRWGPVEHATVKWDVIKDRLEHLSERFFHVDKEALAGVWRSRDKPRSKTRLSPAQDTTSAAASNAVPISRTDIICAMRRLVAPINHLQSGAWAPDRDVTHFRREFAPTHANQCIDSGDGQKGAVRPSPTRIITNYQYVELLGETPQHIVMRLAECIMGKPSELDVRAHLKQMESEYTDSVPHHYSAEHGIWEPVPGVTTDRIPLAIQDSFPKRLATGGQLSYRFSMAVAILDVRGITAEVACSNDQDYPSESDRESEAGQSNPPTDTERVTAPRAEDAASASNIPPPLSPAMLRAVLSRAFLSRTQRIRERISAPHGKEGAAEKSRGERHFRRCDAPDANERALKRSRTSDDD